MLTRAEIEERLKRLTALGAMSTEAHALETAQQLAEWLEMLQRNWDDPISDFHEFKQALDAARTWLEGK